MRHGRAAAVPRAVGSRSSAHVGAGAPRARCASAERVTAETLPRRDRRPRRVGAHLSTPRPRTEREPRLSWGARYFARFSTTSPEPPPDAAGVVHFSSSPLSVKGRFCTLPFQFGNVLVWIWKVIVRSDSFTVYVPK